MNQEQKNFKQENKKLSINTLISWIFIIICSIIIIYTIWKVNPEQILYFLNFVKKSLKLLWPVLKKAAKFFGDLLVQTGKVLWIPISIYVLINFFIKSRFLRILSYLTILCLLSLFFGSYTHFNQIQFNLNFFKNSLNFIGSSLVFSLNAYFFILLLTPKAFWKVFSLTFIFITVGILETIPNLLPLSGALDFSILTGLFSFLFLILHTVASLTQYSANYLNRKFHLPKLEFPFYSAPKSSDDCNDNQKEQLTNVTPMNSKDAAQELE